MGDVFFGVGEAGEEDFVGAWGQGYAFFEHGVEKARIDAVLGGFVGFVKRLRRGVAEKQPEQGADLGQHG